MTGLLHGAFFTPMCQKCHIQLAWCPLWVKRRNFRADQRTSALPRKRTSLVLWVHAL